MATGVLGAMGDVFNMITSSLGLGYNIYQDQRDFGANQQQFQQAMDFARESRDLTMSREDNAIQRRAKDMEAAGINKLLAAGQPAAVGNYASGSPGQGRAGGEQLTNRASATLENSMMDAQRHSLKLSNARTLADIARVEAETKYIDAQRKSLPTYAGAAESQASAAQKQADAAFARLGLTEKEIQLQRDKFEFEKNAYHDKLRALESELQSQQVSRQEAQARMSKMRQEELSMILDRHTTVLRQAALRAGITEQELKNIILEHDSRIYNQSQSASGDRSKQVEIERWLNTLPISQSAKRVLLPILVAGDYIIGLGQAAARSLPRGTLSELNPGY